MNDWTQVRAAVNRAFASHFHSSFASVDEDGHPIVTPIGSLMLGRPGQAVFFPVFASGLTRRLKKDARFSALSVDGRARTWVGALARGGFTEPVGVRLVGRAVGDPRPVTDAEVARWRRRTGFLRLLPGHDALWGRIRSAQDLRVERVDPIRIGKLTKEAAHLTWRGAALAPSRVA